MSPSNSDGHLKWPGNKVRQSFIDFFGGRGHKIVPSSSLVPGDDPTLLFTNAGMVQFKDVLLGRGTRKYKRAVNSQKCMRVAGKHNDLEDVGRDDIHHTFFEMLGNWSFGDYYKDDAIAWAWELLTEVWGLPKEKIWVTVFEDEDGEIPRDDEANEIWRQQPGLHHDHILFFGRDENFWEMADTGPSGPDSEIHFDRGIAYCDKQDVKHHQCRVNGDCNRFLELWNLVFIQYNRLSPTNLESLPEKHIDTGMSLERIVSLLQNVTSNYETDLFTPVMGRIQTLAHHSDEERERSITPYRVIADHSRAAAFMIADGVVPGNTGRNYICRMVIRRASRFGKKLGFEGTFLAEVAKIVIENYGDAYPELRRNQSAILQTLSEEEIKFHRTVEKGITQLNNLIDQVKERGDEILTGKDAFDLYATYGLPLEITRDIVEEDGVRVDEQGFTSALKKHRFVSSTDRMHEVATEDLEIYRTLLKELVDAGDLDKEGVRYDPYHTKDLAGPILALLKDGQNVEKAKAGDSVGVILPQTNFYIEAGGQVSDKGQLVSQGDQPWTIEIEDVLRPIDGLILHAGVVVEGIPKVGDRALAQVDVERRGDIMRNHSATHLLHAALQSILGEHARQAGSLVAPDRLRFDFNHFKSVTEVELDQIERFVNTAILHNHALVIQSEHQRDALAKGAIALFGETYGDIVRTVSIQNAERISYELCGGTHVSQTGIIGPFIITSEGSVGAGIRRIEALSGRGALEFLQEQRAIVKKLAVKMAAPVENLVERLDVTLGEMNFLRENLATQQSREAEKVFSALQNEQVGGILLLRGLIPNVNMKTLLKLSDLFRARNHSGIVVLASSINERPLIVAAITDDLVEKGLHATELVRVVAKEVGGSGGGKPHLAQAGGSDAKKIHDALDQIDKWILSKTA